MELPEPAVVDFLPSLRHLEGQQTRCVMQKPTTFPLTLFDPETAHVVLEPLEAGNGHWVGAPCVIYLPDEKAFYLYYRRRRPRGQEPDRGFACYVARSEDGKHFETIWSASKARVR